MVQKAISYKYPSFYSMGIQGLWPLLKDYIRPGHVGEYRGRRVAVDTYVWLHRAVYGCCVELARGEPSDKWLKYCIEMIDSLLAHDISVYLVFDGGSFFIHPDFDSHFGFTHNSYIYAVYLFSFHTLYLC